MFVSCLISITIVKFRPSLMYIVLNEGFKSSRFRYAFLKLRTQRKISSKYIKYYFTTVSLKLKKVYMVFFKL